MVKESQALSRLTIAGRGFHCSPGGKVPDPDGKRRDLYTQARNL